MNDLVRLFRNALRVSKEIDNPVMKRKFRYNVRDIIETYQNLGNEERSKEIMERAPQVIETLKKLLKYDKEASLKILQTFNYQK